MPSPLILALAAAGSDLPSWITAGTALVGLFGGAIATAVALFTRVRILEAQVAALSGQVAHLEAKIDQLLARALRSALDS